MHLRSKWVPLPLHTHRFGASPPLPTEGLAFLLTAEPPPVSPHHHWRTGNSVLKGHLPRSYFWSAVSRVSTPQAVAAAHLRLDHFGASPPLPTEGLAFLLTAEPPPVSPHHHWRTGNFALKGHLPPSSFGALSLSPARPRPLLLLLPTCTSITIALDDATTPLATAQEVLF